MEGADLKSYLLDNGTVKLQTTAADWKEAVKIGTDMLEEAGAVKPEYYEAILDGVEKLGPYFLIAPGVAMPHGRPEQGVMQNSYALVTLKEPVNFGDPDNDPVDILISLAAVDAKSQNQSGIVQIVTLLDDEAAVEALKKAETLDDLKAIFDSL